MKNKELVIILEINGLIFTAEDISDLPDEDDAGMRYIKDTFNIDLEVENGKIPDCQMSILTDYEDEIDLQKQEMDIREFSVIDNNSNTRDARDMHLELINSDDSFIRRFTTYFSIGIITLSFLYIFLASFLPETSSNAEVVRSTIEFVKTVIIIVVSFWVGSSTGSKTKDEIIASDRQS